MNCWLVGGAVRDALLGLAVTERDWVVVGATPAQMEAAGYRPVGRDFPVFLHPQTGEEYALARTERKQGRGYRGFVVHADPDVSLEADLQRRDLTINAIAQAPDGTLCDPYGGQADLRARLLRHVSPAFVEDPLRILRVARFAARFADLGFHIAEETQALMREMVANGEVDHLVAERVWQETERALATATPAVYFDVLADCGALPRLFPGLAARWQDPESLARPALAQSVRLSSDISVRLAALCHELCPDTVLAEWQDRYPIAAETFAVVARTARWCTTLDAIATAPAEVVRELQRGLDRERRPWLFERVLDAWRAIVAARSAEPGPALERLQRANEAVDAIRGADLAADGWQGVALGQELERRRIEAIRQS